MSADWYRHDAVRGTLSINVHVQPSARTSGFAGLHGDALRVRVAAPAADNKANAALLDFLRREFALPAGAVAIRHGLHGRRKIIVVSNPSSALLERLAALGAS